MNKILIILFSIILTACAQEVEQYWSNVTFDQAISNNNVYSKMDKEDFVYSFYDPNTIKTNNIRYTQKAISRTNELVKDNSFINYDCIAKLEKSNMLTIDIGLHSYFSGSGFNLSVNGSKFIVQPYSYTDVVLENETVPTYKILSQKLTLNKPSYKVGDSLYGSVEFRIIETNEKLQTKHAANGFFRTKITSN